jgi:hypothetical protein
MRAMRILAQFDNENLGFLPAGRINDASDVFCPGCDARIRVSAFFCTNCGISVVHNTDDRVVPNGDTTDALNARQTINAHDKQNEILARYTPDVSQPLQLRGPIGDKYVTVSCWVSPVIVKDTNTRSVVDENYRSGSWEEVTVYRNPVTGLTSTPHNRTLHTWSRSEEHERVVTNVLVEDKEAEQYNLDLPGCLSLITKKDDVLLFGKCNFHNDVDCDQTFTDFIYNASKDTASSVNTVEDQQNTFYPVLLIALVIGILLSLFAGGLVGLAFFLEIDFISKTAIATFFLVPALALLAYSFLTYILNRKNARNSVKRIRQQIDAIRRDWPTIKNYFDS